YHVEAQIHLWRPSIDAIVSSDSRDIVGTDIDIRADLGFENKGLQEFRFVFRPARKHKFRLAYAPISFSGDTTLRRDVVFNGVTYRVGLPLQSEFEWDTWRVGYEYDFLYRDRGHLGFILETRFTTAMLDLRSPVASEFSRVRAPIPAVGLGGKVYPRRNLAVGGEFTFLKVPEISGHEGTLFDFDLSGTYNFTNNFGVSGGFRTVDLSYIAERESGDLQLRGLYFAAVARF
ncbi:MAG TPA: hypothetical protein VIL25_10775, partial [Vicinamibacterales bacterium]